MQPIIAFIKHITLNASMYEVRNHVVTNPIIYKVKRYQTLTLVELTCHERSSVYVISTTYSNGQIQQ